MSTRYIRDLRIGIPTLGNENWLGGVSYVEALFSSIRSLPLSEQPQLYLVSQQPEWLTLYIPTVKMADGIILLGPALAPFAASLPPSSHYSSSYEEMFEHLDFYFPGNLDMSSRLPAAFWIYDFQHACIPEMFSDEERRDRDREFRAISERESILVLSSWHSEQDFHRLFPHARVATRVMSFFSRHPKEWYTKNPADTVKKYSLPENFLICCNQFWTHKNHLRLFEAIAALKARGLAVNLVCTGPKSDHRAPDYFNEVMQRITALGINELVHIIGTIPREDQIQLLRASMALVQPSLFEGWSTVVEDGRAFGKTMILSDFPVHQEQNPKYGIFFDRYSSEDLAAKIMLSLPGLSPGPDLEREMEAQNEVKTLAQGCGRTLCDIALQRLDAAES